MLVFDQSWFDDKQLQGDDECLKGEDELQDDNKSARQQVVKGDDEL